MQLWQQVPLEEGTPMVYLGVHVVRWRQEWGEPAVAFNRVDAPTVAMREVENTGRHTRLSVFVGSVHAGYITVLTDEATALLKVFGTASDEADAA